MSPPGFLKADKDGVLMFVKVQPRASRNEIGEVLGNELKIKVAAPPVDSAANEELVRFLAGMLDCSKGSVLLVRGAASRHKQLRITGLSIESIIARLQR
jgi:uncharacterized protein (TIGR00251 family)